MDEFERLQAAIAEHKRRWKEKYGWYDVPREYPTMEEEMRRERELKEIRATNAYIRKHIRSAPDAYDSKNDDWSLLNQNPTSVDRCAHK
ncbi:hypothetical protein F4827_001063 [Paraburkholderia bannensis]|uniref:Uncharacterized protein n=1 Tax=Paraburkholderia bannensis TaxID=765414 RepID=A0A7W9TTM0_9BURK|nr:MULTISPECIES: hypothetical protein [Paraburkholderia]MBB3256237.1 hypothetical protein [Paraburkholderia sp. WP4_3_2]MBB6101237.1 hypothetical protein [Paraburkholderia bannensis]